MGSAGLGESARLLVLPVGPAGGWHGSELRQAGHHLIWSSRPLLWVLQTHAAPSCLRSSYVRLPYRMLCPSPGICHGCCAPLLASATVFSLKGLFPSLAGVLLSFFPAAGCCPLVPLPPPFCLTYKNWGAIGSLHPSPPLPDSHRTSTFRLQIPPLSSGLPYFIFILSLSWACRLSNPTMYLAMLIRPPTETGPDQTLDSLLPELASPTPPSQDMAHGPSAV